MIQFCNDKWTGDEIHPHEERGSPTIHRWTLKEI